MVRTVGERSLIFVAGRFSHAAKYRAVLDERPRRPVAFAPLPEELTSAARILGGLPSTPLYARLDYLPLDDGRWVLSELELIEPELLFRAEPVAGDRFASAILERLNG